MVVINNSYTHVPPHTNHTPQIIESMADEGEDRRVMAGRALGELVRKMGERVLHRIIPILKEGAASPLVSTRQVRCGFVLSGFLRLHHKCGELVLASWSVVAEPGGSVGACVPQ